MIGKVIDHRGREVRLCSAKSLPPSAPRHVRRAVRTANPAEPFYLAQLAGALILIGTAAVSLATTGAASQRWPVLTAVFLALIVIGTVGHWFLFGRHARSAAGVLLKNSLCPSCAYPLGGLQPGPDGCTPCPECGSAWRRRAEAGA